MTTTPFRLVSEPLSQETIDCLIELLDHAQHGRMLGIAFVAMYTRRRYIVHTAGECRRSRTFTRGMVADLNQQLEATR